MHKTIKEYFIHKDMWSLEECLLFLLGGDGTAEGEREMREQYGDDYAGFMADHASDLLAAVASGALTCIEAGEFTFFRPLEFTKWVISKQPYMYRNFPFTLADFLPDLSNPEPQTEPDADMPETGAAQGKGFVFENGLLKIAAKDYHSKQTKTLIECWNGFWPSYDPEYPESAPQKEEVKAFLLKKRSEGGIPDSDVNYAVRIILDRENMSLFLEVAGKYWAEFDPKHPSNAVENPQVAYCLVERGIVKTEAKAWARFMRHENAKAGGAPSKLEAKKPQT
jgi:hypothetical protein